MVLTGTEQQKLVVLNRVLVGDLTAAEAATALERSVRQVRRMLAAYRKEGAAALAHGNRGRTPGHALAPAQVARVVVLAQTTYAGLNDTHLSEVLAEEEGIVLSRASVRRVRMDAGLPRPRQRRPPAHRRRRERKAQAGMLLQLDGSRHAWLEERGPWLTLIAAIDDATGTVPVALFREQEDAAGYLALLLQVVRSVGVPEAVYHDRHGIFLRAPQDRETLAGGPSAARVGHRLHRRPLTAGQGTGGTALRHVAGPPGRRVAPGWRGDPGRGQRRRGCLSAPLQHPLRRAANPRRSRVAPPPARD